MKLLEELCDKTTSKCNTGAQKDTQREIERENTINAIKLQKIDLVSSKLNKRHTIVGRSPLEKDNLRLLFLGLFFASLSVLYVQIADPQKLYA